MLGFPNIDLVKESPLSWGLLIYEEDNETAQATIKAKTSHVYT